MPVHRRERQEEEVLKKCKLHHHFLLAKNALKGQLRVHLRSYMRMGNVYIYLLIFLSYAAETARLHDLLKGIKKSVYSLPQQEKVDVSRLCQSEQEPLAVFLRDCAQEYKQLMAENQKLLSTIGTKLEVSESRAGY